MHEPREPATRYPPIADYAPIGNERTTALVGRDAGIDWLCLPRFDDPPVFGALLDADRGGRFELAPTADYSSRRRYLPETNVLETTFSTGGGEVRVTDAMTMPIAGGPSWQEVVRSLEGVSGEVELRWRFAPRFGWGSRSGEVTKVGDAVAVRDGDLALLVQQWGGDGLRVSDGAAWGSIRLRAGETGMIAMSVFDDEPWVLASRESLAAGVEQTVEHWRRWIGRSAYDGPYREAVTRSALVLGLLIYAPTGAIVAAPTSSLPERVGGGRNYDYRFAWVRDTGFTLQAMTRLGYREQMHASLAWLLTAVDRTFPRIHILYSLDGDPHEGAVEVEAEGYRGSRPVRAGNDAAQQLQLGNYATLLETIAQAIDEGTLLTPRDHEMLSVTMDYLAQIWRHPDAGIWELPERRQRTQSKFAAWRTLAIADALENRAMEPLGPPGRWRAAAAAIEEFVLANCWSERRGAFVASAGEEALDASTLLAFREEFLEGHADRFRSTLRAIRSELGAGGPLLFRHSALAGEEGAFVACSFWLVEALARLGDRDEAAELFEALLPFANDVGIYSEEIDPGSGDFLGNTPQALSHLSLVNAAIALTSSP